MPGEEPASKKQRTEDDAPYAEALKKGPAFDFSFKGTKQEFDKFWLASWTELGEGKLCTRLNDVKERPATTADSENRLRDKAALKERLGLEEAGDSHRFLYDEHGNVLAAGYIQVLFGDHGDYFELMEKNINWSLFTNHKLKGPGRHYHEHKNADGSIQLYDQFKTVADEPNPPPGAKSKDNNRPEGYAPYRPGVFYMPTEAVARVGYACM